MDSYEKEKKKKKQILTKNMEVKKIKSTTNNLPGADRTKSQVTGNTTEELRRKKTVEGTISAVESTKDIKLDTKKKEPLQMKSHEEVQDEKRRSQESDKSNIMAKHIKETKSQTTEVVPGADRTKAEVTRNSQSERCGSDRIDSEELRRNNTVEGCHRLQAQVTGNTQSKTCDLITSRILEKGKKSATIGSEIGKNKAQILYDQYTFLNENERLVKGGQMSYTNLMQHIILSPRVSLQANEVSEVYNLGIFKK
ncbi:hypothetical protein OsI_16818 [Oryza sativa Indica Group]|uniref:OSJNBa0011L07.11 protein n=4 Tax=Oryza TaxID=4527 RepID=Q7XR90_ORYSJ|nr:hypothetical protein OsI_16818 [Oryza sativa Indica Group]BAH92756.1 Os04g0540400 [Oryza sativa Japonica Group]CAE02787.2 OSJNBa0011L07.11 [Oryza sativa Japonica Group]CAH67393.1 H0115B09.5 [Oryza sativa]|eukprot:NP_001174028.1 Os04g0540400 [Oryza sativa Japonica Group]